MLQSRIESIIESSLNTLSGFILSMLVWEFIIVPIYKFESGIKENLEITAIYTIVSIARSYYWRRFFNNKIHFKLVKLFGK